MRCESSHFDWKKKKANKDLLPKFAATFAFIELKYSR